jgi:hypothetical protein
MEDAYMMVGGYEKRPVCAWHLKPGTLVWLVMPNDHDITFRCNPYIVRRGEIERVITEWPKGGKPQIKYKVWELVPNGHGGWMWAFPTDPWLTPDQICYSRKEAREKCRKLNTKR